jgi:hypothetical protein
MSIRHSSDFDDHFGPDPMGLAQYQRENVSPYFCESASPVSGLPTSVNKKGQAGRLAFL